MILDLDLNIFRFVQLFYLFTCLFYSWIIRSKLRTEIVVCKLPVTRKVSLVIELQTKKGNKIDLINGFSIFSQLE